MRGQRVDMLTEDADRRFACNLLTGSVDGTREGRRAFRRSIVNHDLKRPGGPVRLNEEGLSGVVSTLQAAGRPQLGFSEQGKSVSTFLTGEGDRPQVSP